MVWKRLMIGLLSCLVIGAIALPVRADERAAKLFEVQCAGCHINGGNIVRRGKTLKLKALERNGYGTPEAISEMITNGKGNMSAYRDRLTPEEVQLLAAYVLDQANKDWR